MSAEEKTCPYCAETIKAEAIVCRFCGRDLPTEKSAESVESQVGATESNVDAPSSEEQVKTGAAQGSTKGSRSTGKRLLLIIGGIVVVCIVLFLILMIAAPSTTESSSDGSSDDPTPIPLSSYQEIDVRELESYADEHVDELVMVEGEVFNVDSNRLQIWGDDMTPIVITLSPQLAEEERFYEDDWIRVYGVVQGYASGRNAFDAELSNPEIQADRIEKINEQSGRFSEDTNQETPEEVVEEVTEEATEVSSEKTTVDATRVVEEDTPTPTATPGPPVLGSRENPHPMDTWVSLKSDNQIEFKLSVLEVLRGEEAWQRVLSANSYNDPAPEGTEYVMVKGGVDYNGPDAGTLEISETDFEIVSHGRVYEWYDVESPCCLEPAFEMKLLQGGYGEGWFAWLLPADPEMTLKLGPVFFALYEEAENQES